MENGMNEEVTQYIAKQKPWQIEVCNTLRNIVKDTIKDVEERLQYGKPHYLKNGHYAAVIHVSKDKVSFMLFNAKDITEESGFLRSMGNGDRKTIDITEGQQLDVSKISHLLEQVSSSL